MSKQLLPADMNNEISISWARHQMAVTKMKNDERQSSSHYGLFDSLLPTVNFTEFLADNDSIVDEVSIVEDSGQHHGKKKYC